MGRPGKGEPATSPRRVATALRRGKALEMRAAGKHYEEIYLSLGYSSRSAAVIDVRRALDDTVGEPAAEVRALELRRLDETLQRLDEAEDAVREVMAREHVTISNGRLIRLPDKNGEEKPIPDDDPILRCVDRLLAIEDRRLKVMERRARYLGLDAPAKAEVTHVNAFDAEIAGLVADLAGRGQGPPAGGPEVLPVADPSTT